MFSGLQVNMNFLENCNEGYWRRILIRGRFFRYRRSDGRSCFRKSRRDFYGNAVRRKVWLPCRNNMKSYGSRGFPLWHADRRNIQGGLTIFRIRHWDYTTKEDCRMVKASRWLSLDLGIVRNMEAMWQGVWGAAWENKGFRLLAAWQGELTASVSRRHWRQAEIPLVFLAAASTSVIRSPIKGYIKH